MIIWLDGIEIQLDEPEEKEEIKEEGEILKNWADEKLDEFHREKIDWVYPIGPE
jgi:hypothetical protein